MKKASVKSLLLHWRIHVIPVLVWLGTVVIVLGLFSCRSQRVEILGVAQGQIHQIAVASPGRIEDITVELFDNVTKEETVAIVNTILENEQSRAELQAQMDTILAEIEHLAAQLIPAQDSLLADRADREANRFSDARRFFTDVENTTLEVLRLRALIESDKIALENLSLDVKINSELLEKQAIAPFELQKVQAQYDALAKKVEENESLLAQANIAKEQALQRQDEYLEQQPYNPSVDGVLEVIRQDIVVQEQRMNQVLMQLESLDSREALELKSPIDGVISQILQSQKEVVLAGEPILVITSPDITGIIAYSSEEQMSQIYEGMAVELVRNSGPTKIQIERSEVTYIGPAIEQIPARLWRNPNVPEWGRPFMVKAPIEMELMVGEVLGIRRL